MSTERSLPTITQLVAARNDERERILAMMDNEARTAPDWLGQQIRNTAEWLRLQFLKEKP